MVGYRLVYDSPPTHGMKRVVSEEPIPLASAIAAFNRIISRGIVAAGSGRRVRVLAEQEYQRIYGGTR